MVYLFFAFVANADTLAASSDTITTSRPSASTPLSANVVGGTDATATVYNNGSTFLASDSARLWGQTQETVTIATVSAAKTNLFFTGVAAQSHANGTVISTAITSMHTVSFLTKTIIPSSGSIIISFPNAGASDTNSASPSATTFMFNGLSGTNIKTNNASTCTFTVSQSAGNVSTITCNVNAQISAGTTVTFLIGCSSATAAVCNTQVPTLINPTKSLAAGTADTWTVKVNTYSAASGTGTILDNTSLKIGTVESVNVVAHIDPTFTFTISGVANSLALSSVCTNGGSNPDSTNASFPSTSTDVNLGTLISSATNVAAQKMIITSNSVGGYTITATSSGHLINPANGFYLQDAQGTPTNNETPVPASLAIGSNKFGIHPCELSAQAKITTATWCTGSNCATGPLFANPSPSFYYTLVNSGTAPGSGGDTFYVEYAASPGSTTPAGDYRTVLTYVATVIF